MANIRAGLAANISRAFPDAQCTGYLLSAPTPPAFEIELDAEGIDPHQAFSNGVEDWFLTVRAVLSSGIDIGNQQRMDAYIDSGSVRAAIESDLTLGGACHTLAVRKVGQGGYRETVFGTNPAIPYLTTEWSVEIKATGT